MRYRLNQKGDLALSTNAIVVLIIAVIILGLIITFITQGFGAVEEKFLGQVDSLPDPVAPTASKPVSLTDSLVGSPGSDFGTKVSVYNEAAGAATYSVAITCTGTVLEGTTQSNARSIEPRGHAIFTVVGKIADGATGGRKLCIVTATPATGAPADAPTQTADLVINVRD